MALKRYVILAEGAFDEEAKTATGVMPTSPSPFASHSTRRLVTALAALACAAAFLLGEAIPSRGSAPPRHHTVHAGETLWGIAEHAYPGDDPREAVYRIREANHIPGSAIDTGEELVLP